MTHEQIMDWAENHSYPFLAFGKMSHLSHGRQHYEQLAHSPSRLRRAAKRIAQWDALVASCSGDNSAGVEKLSTVEVQA